MFGSPILPDMDGDLPAWFGGGEESLFPILDSDAITFLYEFSRFFIMSISVKLSIIYYFPWVSSWWGPDILSSAAILFRFILCCKNPCSTYSALNLAPTAHIFPEAKNSLELLSAISFSCELALTRKSNFMGREGSISTLDTIGYLFSVAIGDSSLLPASVSLSGCPKKYRDLQHP